MANKSMYGPGFFFGELVNLHQEYNGYSCTSLVTFHLILYFSKYKVGEGSKTENNLKVQQFKIITKNCSRGRKTTRE